MKKNSLIGLLALPLLVNAQSVQKIYPQSNPSGKSWVDVNEGSSTSFTFTFPGAGVTGSGQNNSYSGYLEITFWADTMSTGSVEDRDSLTVSAEPLFYDVNDIRLERSNDTDRDSLDIKNYYAWGTSHSDAEYSFNVSVNLPPCDGFRINVYTGTGGQGKFRCEGRIAESHTF